MAGATRDSARAGLTGLPHGYGAGAHVAYWIWVVQHANGWFVDELLGRTATLMRICQAITPQQVAIARTLFEEYAAALEIDLSFQGFAAECLGLPGLYARPGGRLLLAFAGTDIAGCVALRALVGGECEMKRLFVRPAFRGEHVGRRLAEQAIEEACAIGYSTMKLDTLPAMEAAIRLYESLGFVRCPAYYKTPLRDTVFMELRLLPSPRRLS